MLVMAEKRKRPSAGKSYPRSGKALNVWIDGPLRDALDALVTQSRRSLTTEVSIALENHLKAAGLWPPVPKEGQEGGK